MVDVFSKSSDLNYFATKILAGLATEVDCALLPSEDVIAIKRDTGVPHFKLMSGESSAVDGKERTRRFEASNEMPDRSGDVVRVAGWNFTNFKKNPVALWAHDDRHPAIGSVVEFEKDVEHGKLFESIQYASAAANALSETLWRLYEERVLRAVSVGFLPIESVYPRDEAERSKIGLGRFGVLYTKQEQLELSCCNIPANPGCLASKDVRASIERLIVDGKIDRSAGMEIVDRLGGSSRGVFAVRAMSTLDRELSEPSDVETRLAALEAKTVALESRCAELGAQLKALPPADKNTDSTQPAVGPAADESAREKSAVDFFEALLAVQTAETA